jgi:TPR repeat protein
MYKRGFFEDGVNMDEARHWFSLSASQGFQLSIDELNSINDV